jgi:hypothetical protein
VYVYACVCTCVCVCREERRGRDGALNHNECACAYVSGVGKNWMEARCYLDALALIANLLGLAPLPQSCLIIEPY